MIKLKSLVTLKNVSKNYKNGSVSVKAITNVTLNILPGKSYAIIGPSGCGKTTLLNLIGLIQKPSEGEILIMGKKAVDFSKKEIYSSRNRFFGYIDQNFLLIESYSVYDNIIIPLIYSKPKVSRKERLKKVKSLLNMFELSEKVNEKICNLSGGQKQRIAIARSMINNCSVIIADEPTGALDINTGEKIMDILLKTVNENRSLIIATHNLTLAKKCSEIIQIKDGEII